MQSIFTLREFCMRAASGHYCGVVIFHSAQTEKWGLPNSLFLETLLKSESFLGVDIFGSYLLPHILAIAYPGYAAYHWHHHHDRYHKDCHHQHFSEGLVARDAFQVPRHQLKRSTGTRSWLAPGNMFGQVNNSWRVCRGFMSP